jgi:Arc/MetJ-type ribon-helix-helix transcriptional regulator
MTTQIAVKLPDEVVGAIDRLVAEGQFRSRSAAVRRALDDLVAASQRASVDRAFARGFRAVPETEAELADATRLAVEAIDDEPWEKWW